MAEIKKISTELQLLDKFLDTSGDAGTSGQVLTSTGTGINWVSAGTPGSGVYLPLSAGSGFPLTGDLYISKSTPALRLNDSGSNVPYELRVDGTTFSVKEVTNNRILMSMTAGAVITLDSLASNTVINTSGAMVVPNGKVGIGTTSPLEKLNIVETTATAGTFFPVAISGARYQADYGVGIAFRPENNSSSYANKTAIVGSGGGYGYNMADLHFCFNNSTTITDEVSLSDAKVTMKRSGNVGIGTTSPDALLDVGVNNIITLDDTGSSTGFIGFGAYNNGTTNIAQGFSYYGFGLEIDRPNQNISFNSYDSNGATTGGTNILVLKRDGNVGIGTASPQSKLHIETGSGGTYNPNVNHDDVTIEGSGNIGLQLFSPATTYQYIAFGDPDSVNAGYIRYYHGTNQMVFRTNGGDNMIINSAGNVGIGNTNPSRPLDVTADTGGVALKLRARSGNDYSFMSFTQNDGSGTAWAELAGIGTGGGLRIDTAGAERMRIDSAGAVKFNAYNGTNNTGSPTHILGTDANGLIVKSTAGSSIGPWLPLAAGSGERVTGDLYISDKLYMRPSSTYGNGYNVMTVTGTGNAPYPTIINFSNYAKPSVMVINDENVGIGTTSPTGKLDVVGSLVTTRVLTTGSLSLIGTDATASAQTVLTISTGVGNATGPNIVLSKSRSQASGAVVASDPLGTIQFQGGNGTASVEGARIQSIAGSTWSSTNRDSDLLFWTTPNASTTIAERMRIDSNGVLQLTSDINGYLNANTIGMEIDINRNPETGTFKDTGLSHARIIMRGDTTANGGSNIKFVTSPTVNTVGTTKMTIAGDGNVGIGTDSPVSNLDIFSTGTSTLTLSYDGGAGTGSTIDFSLINAGVSQPITTQIKAIDDGFYRQNLSFLTKTSATGASALSTRMIILATGNVGIGVTSPSTQLEIASNTAAGALKITQSAEVTGNAMVYIDNNSASNKPALRIDVTAGGNATDTHGVLINNSGPGYGLIVNGGNVGIETTSPAVKLDVAGGINAGGDITATGADFTLAHAAGATVYLRRDDTSISDGNVLGLINFQGDDPTDGTFNTGVALMGRAAGDWASGSYESEFILQTRNTSGGLVTALTVNEAQNIKFNAYGAGTLVTDASGNITAVTSGAGTGTVTSITKGAGLVVAGSPITTTGSVAVEYAANVQNIITGGSNFIGDTVVSTDQILITDPGSTSTNRRVGRVEIGDLPFLPLAGGTMSGGIVFSSQDGATCTPVNWLSYLCPDSSGTTVNAKIGEGVVIFPDTSKVTFGDGQDLQIYHSGTHSYIKDTGTGSLYLQTNGSAIYLQDTDGNAMAQFTDGGGSFLFYNGNSKLSTTNTGVSVEGQGIFTGNVGIGVTGPDVKLHVTASEDGSGIDKGTAKFINTATGSGATTMHIVQTTANSFGNAIKFWQGSTPTAVGFIRLTTSATQFITSASDLNLKKNITNWSDNTLSKFKALEPKKFRFKTQDASEDKTPGFIAQNEVDNFPEAYPQFLGDDEKPYYGFNPIGMVPHLMKAIKDLVEKVETLENKITQLENNK